MANCELWRKSRRVHKSVTNDLIPGNAVPTVKITLGTPFPGVPAGNDPCLIDSAVSTKKEVDDIIKYLIIDD